MSGSACSGPEWILSTEAAMNGSGAEGRIHLSECAVRVWPRLRSFGRRALGLEVSSDEKDLLVSQAFEQVLLSASKALVNTKKPILDLDAYLSTAFRHEVVRLAKQEKRFRKVVQYMAPEQLDLVQEVEAGQSSLGIEEKLLLEKVIREMDEWTRGVWVALTYGLSWQEISESLGMDKEQAKQKFRYAIKKIKARLS
jgi:RNA polymerase sigma factor (sigma-70 family)